MREICQSTEYTPADFKNSVRFNTHGNTVTDGYLFISASEQMT